MASTTIARKAPAKKAPAKVAAAPAVKAAAAPKALPAAKKAAPKATGLRWSYPEGRDNRAGNPQTAVRGEHSYAITGADKAWKATHTYKGKTTVLAEGVSKMTAYNKVVAHNKATA
jgi:hypothetical protein